MSGDVAVPPAHASGYGGDDRWLLLWAALIGIAGALATAAFHEGMTFAERIATGSWIGQWGRFEDDNLRFLLACGAAAGFASAYDAALSGAIFIAEIVYGTLSIRRLGPLMMASVTAFPITERSRLMTMDGSGAVGRDQVLDCGPSLGLRKAYSE